jgi:hypothetical protein
MEALLGTALQSLNPTDESTKVLTEIVLDQGGQYGPDFAGDSVLCPTFFTDDYREILFISDTF